MFFVLFSFIFSKESIILNSHFHRLSDGTVITHSHKNTNKNHNHSQKEIITLDKFYYNTSNIEEIFSITNNNNFFNLINYTFTNKSILYRFLISSSGLSPPNYFLQNFRLY
jgi:hypothetical protein